MIPLGSLRPLFFWKTLELNVTFYHKCLTENTLVHYSLLYLEH